jgi:predicted regulator of Ras-like GTPase activity (Roadblock/LC7/MglB family)
MKTGLQEINSLVGIWGSLIIDNQGTVIVNAAPSGLNQAALASITNHAVELFSSAGDSLPDLTEAVFHYSQKKLFMLDLKQAILIVICTPSADISLLRMTANVVVTNWGADPKVQKQLQKHYVERL